MPTQYLAPGRPPQSGYHITLNTAKPKGYEQITVSSSAVGLTVPTDANMAMIRAGSADVRWRDDGSAPTSAVGMPLLEDEVVSLTNPVSLAQFSAIRSGADAVLNVSYYEV